MLKFRFWKKTKQLVKKNILFQESKTPQGGEIQAATNSMDTAASEWHLQIEYQSEKVNLENFSWKILTLESQRRILITKPNLQKEKEKSCVENQAHIRFDWCHFNSLWRCIWQPTGVSDHQEFCFP